MDVDNFGARIVARGRREWILDNPHGPDADRAALIGQLHQRKDAAWLRMLRPRVVLPRLDRAAVPCNRASVGVVGSIAPRTRVDRVS